MNKFEEINLGFEAIEYIYDCLKFGNTLSQYILQSFDLKNGKVMTYLPSDIRADSVKEFYYGGKFLNLENDFKSSIKLSEYPTSFLISLIELQLKSGENRVCIIENAIARPQDPCLSLLSAKSMIYNDEVYHIFTKKDAVYSSVKNDLLRIKSVPTFIGVITSLPIKVIESLNNKKEIVFEDLEVITNGIEKLFVGAYDGESYIIWSKD